MPQISCQSTNVDALRSMFSKSLKGKKLSKISSCKLPRSFEKEAWAGATDRHSTGVLALFPLPSHKVLRPNSPQPILLKNNTFSLWQLGKGVQFLFLQPTGGKKAIENVSWQRFAMFAPPWAPDRQDCSAPASSDLRSVWQSRRSSRLVVWAARCAWGEAALPASLCRRPPAGPR